MELIGNWWINLYYYSVILSNMNGWSSKNHLYNTLVLQREEKKNWVNFQTNEPPWVVFTIGKRLKVWGKVGGGGLPYKLWSIIIFWSRKTQSILGLCKEQKIQTQKYVEVDEEKDPRVVVHCVGHRGEKNWKKMRFKGFKTKEQSQNPWPLR